MQVVMMAVMRFFFKFNFIFYEAEDEVPETERYPAGRFTNVEKAFWKTKKGQMDIDDDE